MATGQKSPLFVRKQPGGVFVVTDERVTTGDVWFVDSGSATGADSVGSGRNPDGPFLTIDYAIGQCTANNGDIIYVMPGHTESTTGAAGIDFDIAGVRVIGIGTGADRPTITHTATASTIHMDEAGSWLENVLITCSADSTVGIDIDKTDCVLKDVEIRNAAAKEFVTMVNIDGGAANACDRATITGCTFDAPNAGSDRAIGIDEVADRMLIADCTALGDYAKACVHGTTGVVATKLVIRDCLLENTQTGDHAIELEGACTGLLARNLYLSDIALPGSVDPGSCFSIECYGASAIDVNGVLAPATT